MGEPQPGEHSRALAMGPFAAVTESLRVFAGKALYGRQFELARWALDQSISRGPVAQGYAQAVQVVREVIQTATGWTASDKAKASALALGYVEAARSSWSYGHVVNVESELLEHQGDLPAAIHVFREALRLFPARSDFHNNLAYLLARRDQNLEEALKLVQRARLLSPMDGLAYLDTEGWVLHRLGRNEEALKRLRQAIRYATTADRGALAETLFHLGKVHEALGQREEATQAFLRARRMDPTGPFGEKAAQQLKKM